MEKYAKRPKRKICNSQILYLSHFAYIYTRYMQNVRGRVGVSFRSDVFVG